MRLRRTEFYSTITETWHFLDQSVSEAVAPLLQLLSFLLVWVAFRQAQDPSLGPALITVRGALQFSAPVSPALI